MGPKGSGRVSLRPKFSEKGRIEQHDPKPPDHKSNKVEQDIGIT